MGQIAPARRSVFHPGIRIERKVVHVKRDLRDELKGEQQREARLTG
ncbi:MAG: hypothetical protein WA741_29010 [Candidatus Sulfotelmatobacter sp.]